MIDYIIPDEWSIVEEGFDRNRVEQSESLFALGNGRMGGRANFEEQYSGPSLQGNYVAGVYYPDKTRVGWWKNGYPEYFAKVINAADWAGIRLFLNDQPIDLNEGEITQFRRELNMKGGFLQRNYTFKINGFTIEAEIIRFLSIVQDEVGALQYEIKLVEGEGTLRCEPHVDFDVKNADANYDEKFWEETDRDVAPNQIYLVAKTKKLDFRVCSGMRWQFYMNGEKLKPKSTIIEKTRFASNRFEQEVKAGDTVKLIKFGTNVSSENYPNDQLVVWARENLSKARKKGFDTLLQDQKDAWAAKWQESDIEIKGDIKAQQAIRFNIFHLYQTYTGEDERLNIGPKGFTGEKYGGSTYWDTEAYCLPFYMSTADQKVARQLLIYRHNQLDKAIENATKLGFENGAALYPMVTMNGEECHNEWEITFEEIHRNGAIAYAIWRYINYTGDINYLADYGFDVLLGISRFWSQRITFSEKLQKFVMLGVTGPNEYENNVDNNWYTNFISNWCMQYTLEAVDWLKANKPERYEELKSANHFNESEETSRWKSIIDNMYFPYDEERGVYLQQDNFLNKEIIPAADLPESQRPINQHWSWDRILRSCFIKQADVLQGFYFFQEQFSEEAHRKHFDFYEPITVHESSLSPCIHVILATKLNKIEKAYEMYLRTARLDLDDYNSEVHQGLHITSMAGTWMSIVEGFGGFKVVDNKIHLNPVVPKEWEGFSFKIRFRKNVVNVEVQRETTVVHNESGDSIDLVFHGETHTVAKNESVELKHA